jgi:DNA helicase-2/ATP-dependent DNA helicase PcrA
LDLNEKQKDAVEYRGKYLLINAGPGSGKTRVITERVNWIAANGRKRDANFLMLTFTNHAAGVMRQRLNPEILQLVEASTFHSFCYWVLKRAGISFTVIDDDDQKQAANKVCKLLGRDTSIVPSVIEHINLAKSSGSGYEKFVDVCIRYDLYLSEHNYMDFGDLQVKALDYIGNTRYDHVLVDEFHDTSPVQMEIIKRLEPTCLTLTVVCDDQQSIYGWRGADISNIIGFRDLYPDSHVITLDRNYRSTKSIIKSINNLITYASEKICDKELYTERKHGTDLYINECADEDEESELVAYRIGEIYRKTNKYSDNMVLFRTNAQSRAIEHSLSKAGIPYSLLSTTSFYRRKEIKDIIAYLRYLVNEADELSLMRIINTPPRGIGKVTVDKLISEYGSLCSAVNSGEESTKLMLFREIITGLRSDMKTKGVGDMITSVLERTGYRNYIEESKDDSKNSGRTDSVPTSLSDKAKKLENVNSLLNNAYSIQEKGTMSLADYVAMVALVSDADSMYEDSAVKIMTIHAAKGMESKYVHIIGVENNVLPHMGSDVEEERRLMYVAVSRAMDLCMITYCKRRMIGGKFVFTGRSMFIEQLMEPR